MPYLEIDNVQLPQSVSIARYLAKEANLAGKTNLEQAKADAIVDTCIDALNESVKVLFGTPEPEKVNQKINFIILLVKFISYYN